MHDGNVSEDVNEVTDNLQPGYMADQSPEERLMSLNMACTVEEVSDVLTIDQRRRVVLIDAARMALVGEPPRFSGSMSVGATGKASAADYYELVYVAAYLENGYGVPEDEGNSYGSDDRQEGD